MLTCSQFRRSPVHKASSCRLQQRFTADAIRSDELGWRCRHLGQRPVTRLQVPNGRVVFYLTLSRRRNKPSEPHTRLHPTNNMFVSSRKSVGA
ncbi:unnamed protein product, partial [Nesidiocoris tenuis]